MARRSTVRCSAPPSSHRPFTAPTWLATVAVALPALLAACGRGAVPEEAGGAPPDAAPGVAGPRLYVLDCGTIAAMDPAVYNLKAEEIARGDTSFVSPCFLVVHPEGSMVWDVGQIPDAEIPDDGTEVVRQDILKATRRLSTQLAAIGHPVASIDYVAMSHYHLDHTANANAFAHATWIVQQAEYDVMFGDRDVGIRDPSLYSALKDAKRITLQDADHDVFGDGSVVIKTAPGHTPGHQMLFLRLPATGPVLLVGDLYHLPEEKALDRVPTFDFDPAMTRATRRRTDTFVAETGAQLWITHDPPTVAGLRKAPAYYE